MTDLRHDDHPERPADGWDDDAYETGAPTPVDAPEPPARRRRKPVTPARAGLLAIALVGAGFLGGVEVQKGQGGAEGAAGGARAGGFPAGAAAGTNSAGVGSGRSFGGAGGGAGSTGGAGAGGAQATTGTVSSKKGDVLYVETSDGTTVKVRAGKHATITRTAGASAEGIYPGDTVVVQGSTASSGTVTATTLTATAKGVSNVTSGGGAGASGGGPGGAPPTSSAPPAG